MWLGGFSAHRLGLAALLAIPGLALLAPVRPAAAQEPAAARPVCDEDRSGEAPTIASRFDLGEADATGTNFREAKDRAVRWCARQSCTVEGRSVERKPAIYALGILRRRFIAGFRCTPPGPNPAPEVQSVSTTDLTFTFDDPSGIDRALGQANARCASTRAKAELIDLRKKDRTYVAAFSCGS